MKSTVKGIAALAIALLLLFGIFVWPTQYRYDQFKTTTGASYPVRVSRFTGKAEFLSPRGWISMQQSETKPSEELSPQETAKLDGEARIDDIGYIRADIYNGSSKTITGITVSVTVEKKDGTVQFTREYILTPEYSGLTGPRSSSTYSARLGFVPTANQKWSWNVVKARGY